MNAINPGSHLLGDGVNEGNRVLCKHQGRIKYGGRGSEEAGGGQERVNIMERSLGVECCPTLHGLSISLKSHHNPVEEVILLILFYYVITNVQKG